MIVIVGQPQVGFREYHFQHKTRGRTAVAAHGFRIRFVYVFHHFCSAVRPAVLAASGGFASGEYGIARSDSTPPVGRRFAGREPAAICQLLFRRRGREVPVQSLYFRARRSRGKVSQEMTESSSII